MPETIFAQAGEAARSLGWDGSLIGLVGLLLITVVGLVAWYVKHDVTVTRPEQMKQSIVQAAQFTSALKAQQDLFASEMNMMRQAMDAQGKLFAAQLEAGRSAYTTAIERAYQFAREEATQNRLQQKEEVGMLAKAINDLESTLHHVGDSGILGKGHSSIHGRKEPGK